jgi:hypothetical protein
MSQFVWTVFVCLMVLTAVRAPAEFFGRGRGQGYGQSGYGPANTPYPGQGTTPRNGQGQYPAQGGYPTTPPAAPTAVPPNQNAPMPPPSATEPAATVKAEERAPSRPAPAEKTFAVRIKAWRRGALKKNIGNFTKQMDWLRDREADRRKWLEENETFLAKIGSDSPYLAYYRERSYQENKRRNEFILDVAERIKRTFTSTMSSIDDANRESLRYAQQLYLREGYDGKPVSLTDQMGSDQSWRYLEQDLESRWQQELARQRSFIPHNYLVKREDPASDIKMKRWKNELIYYEIYVDDVHVSKLWNKKEIEDGVIGLVNGKTFPGFQVSPRGHLFYEGKKITYNFVRDFHEGEPRTQAGPSTRDIYGGLTAGAPVALPYPAIEDKEAQETIREQLRLRGWYLYYYLPHHNRLVAEYRAFKDRAPEEYPTLAVLKSTDEGSFSPYEWDSRAERLVRVEDTFGRDLSKEGLTLQDWEGFMANRAIEIVLKPGMKAELPMHVSLNGNNSQLYFNLPSRAGPTGPVKDRIRIIAEDGSYSDHPMLLKDSNSELRLYISVRPDRDNQPEEFTLNVRSIGKGKTINDVVEEKVALHVVDEDTPEINPSIFVPLPDRYSKYRRPPTEQPFEPLSYRRPPAAPLSLWHFPLAIDFTRDPSRYFYNPDRGELIEPRASIYQQAAKDVLFFLAPSKGAHINRLQEETSFTDRGLAPGQMSRPKTSSRKNQIGFDGFMVYPTAGDVLDKGAVTVIDKQWSGGFDPTSNDIPHSAQTHIEGIHHQPGYSYEMDPRHWYVDDFQNPMKPVSLYAISWHEIFHALGLNSFNKVVRHWLAAEQAVDMTLEYYHDHFPKLAHYGANYQGDIGQLTVHFPNEIDPVSQHNAFGSPEGEVPTGQWLIHKSVLLMLNAAGIPIRMTSAFRPLKFDPSTLTLPEASSQTEFVHRFKATGGSLGYDWEIVAGSFPDGLKLNRFTGEITGRPRNTGAYYFVLSLSDQDKMPLLQAMSLVVN